MIVTAIKVKVAFGATSWFNVVEFVISKVGFVFVLLCFIVIIMFVVIILFVFM